MTSPSFRAGDTVAITYNGVARNGSDDGYVTLDDKNGSVHLSILAASNVSIVKRPLQVGDILLGSELQNSAQAPGSVARSGSTISQVPWIRTTGGWRSADNTGPIFDPTATFTILYLGA